MKYLSAMDGDSMNKEFEALERMKMEESNMTLQELLLNKYLKQMIKITQKEWDEIKYIAKCENKKVAEIVYRTIYFTYEDYKHLAKDDEFFKTLIEARENHYIKEVRVKYGYDKYYLTQKGLKAYKVI